MNPKCTVVIMAYNEGNSLASVVEEIRTELDKSGLSFEILVINDGSTDRTPEVIADLLERYSEVKAVHHEPNKGLGEVYRTGFREASGQWLTFYPGDGQIPAEDIHGFLGQMPQYDLVLGTIPQRPVPLYVKALSYGERLLYRLLIGKMPRFQGIMMVRTAVLKELSLVSQGRGWTILMEMILKVSQSGYRVGHAKTGLRDRSDGASKVNNLTTIISNLKQLIALNRSMRRGKVTRNSDS